jgi:hypothetical protein
MIGSSRENNDDEGDGRASSGDNDRVKRIFPSFFVLMANGLTQYTTK